MRAYGEHSLLLCLRSKHTKRRQCFSVFSFYCRENGIQMNKQLNNAECFQLDHAVFMTICYNTLCAVYVSVCVLKECPKLHVVYRFHSFSDGFFSRILVIRLFFFILARYKLMVFCRFVIYWCCIVLRMETKYLSGRQR